jgi:hypothetical protein
VGSDRLAHTFMNAAKPFGLSEVCRCPQGFEPCDLAATKYGKPNGGQSGVDPEHGSIEHMFASVGAARSRGNHPGTVSGWWVS